MSAVDPLTVPCSACLADPGQPCYSVSSDQPRAETHRMRRLAAAKRLKRCEACHSMGWVPEGEDQAERCDDEAPTLYFGRPKRCELAPGHDAHRSGGNAWTYLRADDIEREARAKELIDIAALMDSDGVSWITAAWLLDRAALIARGEA